MTGVDAPLAAGTDVSIAELLNRVLDRGVVISGDVVISVAGVDLVYLGLQLVLSSVEALRAPADPPAPEGA